MKKNTFIIFILAGVFCLSIFKWNQVESILQSKIVKAQNTLNAHTDTSTNDTGSDIKQTSNDVASDLQQSDSSSTLEHENNKPIFQVGVISDTHIDSKEVL